MPVTKTCPRCGDQFSVPPSDAERRKYCSATCKKVQAQACGQCGISFVPLNKSQQYCSRSCAQMRQWVAKTCDGCGREFSGPPSIMRSRRHCSKECQRRQVAYTCENCGATRTVRPSETAKRFCGDPCRLEWFSKHFTAESSPHWQGGSINYHGPNWKRQRRETRKRDGYTCQHCGAQEAELPERLWVAHKVPFREFGVEGYREANRLGNLVSLCRPCHLRYDWENGCRT